MDESGYTCGRRRRWVPLAVLTGALALIAAGSARVAAQDAKPPTIWDGVYSEAQAARGSAAFGASCANCHTFDAAGNRPLSGDRFWQRYTQRTVAELITFVRTSMPNSSPNSLPASTYNDIVALILKSNGFPAGATELAPETIPNVQIIPKDGPGELPANTLVRIVGCLAPKSGSDWTLTSATEPERIEKTVVGAEDATKALGTRTTTLKFVLTRLDAHIGKRMSVTGLLLGKGGVDGLNVSTVNRVAETCP